MHLFIYACMHACMYACMHVCVYACMHVCMYACMHVCMYTCMHVYACICMYMRAYVCNPNFALTTKKTFKKPHPGCLEAHLLLKMKRKDESPKNLTIKKHPCKKGLRGSSQHIENKCCPQKWVFSYSNLLKIKPIWAFATQPLVLAMPRSKKPHPEGWRRPKARF
jgi:hypothetical protein